MIELPLLPPGQLQSWHVLLDLAEYDLEHWCLIGGLMVYLHAAEAGVVTPRSTDDIDVVVNVMSKPDATRWLSSWLVDQGFSLDGVSPEGIGHRFVKQADPGPGSIRIDVLAPDNLGPRAKLVTKPPARTIEVPGGRQAVQRSEIVDVRVMSGVNLVQVPRTGPVRRPTILSALLVKAAATRIAGRRNPERDYQDAAVLLASVLDPIELRDALDKGTKGDRKLARRLEPMLDTGHGAWEVLEPSQRTRGQATLSFLLDR